MSYDTIITYLGEFGAYQKLICSLTWISYLPHALHMINIVFLNEEPPFRCAVPGLDNDTFQIQSPVHRRLISDSIPFDSDTGQYSQCKAYDDYHNWNGSDTLSNRTTISCDRWVYDHSAAPNSMVPEFNLVCERKIFKSHMGMILMVGLLMGSFCGGSLSDIFGRKRIWLATLSMWIAMSISLAFVTSTIAVMIIKLFMSAFGIASFLAGFVLDESPRWLLIKNKPEEAKGVIRKIAKRNKVKLPSNIESIERVQLTLGEDRVKQDKVWTILGDKVMMMRLVILGLNWGIINMCFYGFTLNVGDIIPGNLYVNLVIQSLLDGSSNILCIICSGRMGRKPLYCGCILLGGFGCLFGAIFPLLSVDKEWLNLTLFSVGRFGLGGAFSSIYIVTAEMLPTTSRNFGLGLCSVSGRVFGVLVPYTAALGMLIPGRLGEVFPLMVFGIGSIMSGLSIFLLPETRDQTLPDTVKNAVSTRRETIPELQEMMAIPPDVNGATKA